MCCGTLYHVVVAGVLVQDDDEAEEQLKLKILEIYNGAWPRVCAHAIQLRLTHVLSWVRALSAKLQERLVRKRFVLERGLLVRATRCSNVCCRCVHVDSWARRISRSSKRSSVDGPRKSARCTAN